MNAGRAWAYGGAILGGGVSIAANVLHSYVPPVGEPVGWRPETGAVFGAVFWPVALLTALEVLARVDWPEGARWQLVRWGGLTPVAVVAAVVSYRHMAGLLTHWQEDALTAALGPLAVDGLMVMAAGALLATMPALAKPRVQGLPDLPTPAPIPAGAASLDDDNVVTRGTSGGARPRGRPAGRPDVAQRQMFVDQLAVEIAGTPNWRPSYPDLMVRFGRGRSATEGVVRDARKLAAPAEPRLHAVGGSRDE